MAAKTLVAWIIIALTGFTASVVAGEVVGSRFAVAERDAFLALHNTERRDVGVPPLEWSPKLAAYAQAWADELARTGRFEHRPPDGEWAERYGENITIGFGDGFGAGAAVRMWLDERVSYEPGTPIPDDFSTFTAGHYTQIVWRGTKHVGAGKAIVQTGERAGWTIIVANYDPSGNRYGEKPY